MLCLAHFRAVLPHLYLCCRREIVPWVKRPFYPEKMDKLAGILFLGPIFRKSINPSCENLCHVGMAKHHFIYSLMRYAKGMGKLTTSQAAVCLHPQKHAVDNNCCR
jgi:hypothetical protein